MIKTQNNKNYDLEARTLRFAKSVRLFVDKVSKTLINLDDLKQLLRSSGSVGANYIEANEALSKKDFILRIKICRKETKETIYWLNLIDLTDNQLLEDKQRLIKEATELMKIFGSILEKCK